MVTGGQDDLLSIWCPGEAHRQGGALVARCQGHHSWVTSVAFDPWRCDERNYRFGSVGEDRRICLWDFSVGMLNRPRAVGSFLLLLLDVVLFCLGVVDCCFLRSMLTNGDVGYHRHLSDSAAPARPAPTSLLCSALRRPASRRACGPTRTSLLLVGRTARRARCCRIPCSPGRRPRRCRRFWYVLAVSLFWGGWGVVTGLSGITALSGTRELTWREWGRAKRWTMIRCVGWGSRRTRS